MKNDGRGNILTTPLGWVYVDIGSEYFCMFRIPPSGEDCSIVHDEDCSIVHDQDGVEIGDIHFV